MQGYHGDTSATFFVGEVSEEAISLVKVGLPGRCYLSLFYLVQRICFISNILFILIKSLCRLFMTKLVLSLFAVESLSHYFLTDNRAL